MRWLFLLLLMLNGLYYVWHQQEAPLRAKEVLPLSLLRAEQRNIHLLSESQATARPDTAGRESRDECLYLGGFARADQARAVEQRLKSLDVQSEPEWGGAAETSAYWLRISPESRRLVSENLLKNLAEDFPELKNRIMSCAGIATSG
jgi:hypothetical protein